MLLPPWRSPLQKALHLNRSQPHSRYLQLATVTPLGKPTNRSVVFRGFFDDNKSIQIITDTRSQKFTHLQYQPWAEICWYFSKTREQFRLSGNITLVTAENRSRDLIKARDNCWHNLSDAGKRQFFWATPRELISNDQTKSSARGNNVTGNSAESPEMEIDPNQKREPPPNFCLLLLSPELVDHLQLKGEPQNRHLYVQNQDQTWSIKRVNP
jgi:PPOX class probable FMN-dependent enzyme